MTKKLNVDQITNQLEGSSFFPGRRADAETEAPAHTEPVEPSTTPVLLSDNKETRTVARTHERPYDRTVGQRNIKRYAFEFYQDQLDALQRLSLQEKIEGGKGSKSEMVREAIDDWLKKHARTENS